MAALSGVAVEGRAADVHGNLGHDGGSGLTRSYLPFRVLASDRCTSLLGVGVAAGGDER